MKKLMEENAGGGRRRVQQVFADFCELAAIAVRNSVDVADEAAHQSRERRYFEILDNYSSEEAARFPLIMVELVTKLEEQPSDVLGDLFMSLDMGNERTGQFFTPSSVSALMAEMTVPAAVEQLNERPFITLNEPAVGSGGMVIEFANTMRSKGHNPQRRLHVTAMDIDPTAVHMTYLQLSLLFIPAQVFHANTLTLETFDTWPTPAHVVDGWNERLLQGAPCSQRPEEKSAP